MVNVLVNMLVNMYAFICFQLLVRLRDSGRNTSRSKHGQVVTGEESCMLYYKVCVLV